MKDQENIIARARRGDAGAFEQLVETYRDQVYRIALRMCGNAADADEAAQEAFLAAWKGLCFCPASAVAITAAVTVAAATNADFPGAPGA